MFSNIFLALTDVTTDSTAAAEALAMGGFLGAIIAFIAAMMLIAIIVGVALYVYTSLALYTTAKKLKYKNAWLAWIPIANIALILQLGDFHWALIFLGLIPILGWLALSVLLFISMWRYYEKRKYSGWLALVSLLSVTVILAPLAMIAHLVIMGFVAWKDK